MAPKRSIKCVSNQCKAILNGKTRLTSHQRRLLNPHKRALRTIANPRTSDRTKKKLLNQKGGFLGALLGALASSAIGPIINAIRG